MNEICNSTVLKVVLGPVKNLVKLIMIIGPLLCICSIVYTFIKLMQDPDDKKKFARIKNSFIALIVLFFRFLKLINIINYQNFWVFGISMSSPIILF